ncbi:hypothetical protein, partial [Faecalicatena contorta]|uniref:hypothetical protein n=1 Tax=Faecalicatena contorta TaxID=39482 RepID=UPI001A9A9740
SGRLSAIPSWSWRIQPAGKGLVPKVAPQTGAAYGIELAGILCPQQVYISNGIRFQYQNNSIHILKMKRYA